MSVDRFEVGLELEPHVRVAVELAALEGRRKLPSERLDLYPECQRYDGDRFGGELCGLASALFDAVDSFGRYAHLSERDPFNEATVREPLKSVVNLWSIGEQQVLLHFVGARG